MTETLDRARQGVDEDGKVKEKKKKEKRIGDMKKGEAVAVVVDVGGFDVMEKEQRERGRE